MLSKLFCTFLIIVGISQNTNAQAPCTLKTSNLPGTCTNLRECASVLQEIRTGKRDYSVCEVKGRTLFVCCPDAVQTITPATQPIVPSISEKLGQAPDPDLNKLRTAERKCHEYSKAVYEKASNGLAVLSEEVLRDTCGFKSVPLIVGGTAADPREFPHMALIGYNHQNQTMWLCGGSLISERYILTAAHCIQTQYGTPKLIRLGELDLLSDEDEDDPENFEVESYESHPQFRRTSKYHDIALIKLKRDVKFNKYKRPACLPLTNENAARKVIATGWGHTKWSGSGSNYLQKVILNKFTQEECTEVYNELVTQKLRNGIQYRTQLCAGSKSEEKDTCQGDSGGPIQIYIPSIHCMYEIVGVTSFGIMCGTPGVPGVYTRVFAYLDWIEQKVWN